MSVELTEQQQTILRRILERMPAIEWEEYIRTDGLLKLEFPVQQWRIEIEPDGRSSMFSFASHRMPFTGDEWREVTQV